MNPNRYLGVSCSLPTRTDHIRYEPARHGTFSQYLARYADVPDFDTGEVERFAFPGGYEIVLHYEDGEDVCVPCANRILSERVESLAVNLASGGASAHPFDMRDYYAREEVIAGFSSMDQTDTCAQCVECSRYILASGCERDEDGRVTHGEYCSHYSEPCTRHNIQQCSDPHCVGNVLLAEVRDAERWAGTS